MLQSGLIGQNPWKLCTQFRRDQDALSTQIEVEYRERFANEIVCVERYPSAFRLPEHCPQGCNHLASTGARSSNILKGGSHLFVIRWRTCKVAQRGLRVQGD